MITADALRNQRDLETTDLRLVQNGPQFSDSVLRSLGDQDAIRLTGTHATFNLESVRSYLASLPGRADRADWAVIRKSDGSCIGEAVLNELDADNATMNFRIMLSGDGARERGYGTQTTRAVRDYGFDDVGLNRIGLEVYSFNPRAIRVYDKAGFQREGVRRDALNWDGVRHDAIVMGMLTSDPRPWATLGQPLRPRRRTLNITTLTGV